MWPVLTRHKFTIVSVFTTILMILSTEAQSSRLHRGRCCSKVFTSSFDTFFFLLWQHWCGGFCKQRRAVVASLNNMTNVASVMSHWGTNPKGLKMGQCPPGQEKCFLNQLASGCLRCMPLHRKPPCASFSPASSKLADSCSCLVSMKDTESWKVQTRSGDHSPSK